MLNFILIFVIVLAYSWIVSRLFMMAYSIVMSPFMNLSKVMLETTSEGYQNSVMSGYGIFSKLFGYYLACIWSAFMVYWIVIPNSPDTSWWVYGLALAGFLMARCVDRITLSMFAIFCFKPELIDLIYSWVPFRIMYLDYPWHVTAL